MVKGKKGDIEVLADPITGAKIYIAPKNLKIAYGNGQYKEIGSILTDHEEKIQKIKTLEEENLKLKTSMKNTLKIVEVLAKQLSINNTEVLELIQNNIMEE